MICEKCNKEFFEDWRKYPKGEPRFCSRECSNSRIWTNEHKKRVSKKVKETFELKEQNFSEEERVKRKQLALKASNIFKQKKLEELLNEDVKNLSFGRLRKRIIYEQKNKCAFCGIEKWYEKKIILELDHIDGNNKNNSRANLRCLCPNCHSTTDTWRGKNKFHKRKKKVSDEELVETFIEEGNIRKTLLKLGMAAKGANYGRVKKALTIRNIKY